MESNTLNHNAFREMLIIARRGLLRYIRLPQLLFFSSAQPIMILFVFDFVFGGAIATGVPGGKYINYLLPGLLVQMVMFGGVQTGIGLAEDMGNGIIDRLRSLPMSRLAVVAGRTLSDAARNFIALLIMVGLGYVLGFRFQNAEGAIALLALSVLFGYALSWVFAFVGMAIKNAESVEAASMMLIFPLSFASSSFVPIQSMPSWLQGFAFHQPVTYLVNASRNLALGLPDDNGSIWKVTIWCVAILAIFIPLAVRQYRKATTK